MSTNGEHVSRAEMLAHIQPMREDISEVKADVKALLAANVGLVAVAKYKRWVVGLTVTAFTGILASVATLVWLAVG